MLLNVIMLMVLVTTVVTTLCCIGCLSFFVWFCRVLAQRVAFLILTCGCILIEFMKLSNLLHPNENFSI